MIRMASLMGVISNPLDFHLLPLSFCLPGVEELWTATLRFLPATWPTKQKGCRLIHGTEEDHILPSLQFLSLKR